MKHLWKRQYSALYDRTYRVLFDAGITEQQAVELATHRTIAVALRSCERPFRFLAPEAVAERKCHGCASDPEQLANKCHFAMCQTCDMDEPIHDDTGPEAFDFHRIAWNDPIRSD